MISHHKSKMFTKLMQIFRDSAKRRLGIRSKKFYYLPFMRAGHLRSAISSDRCLVNIECFFGNFIPAEMLKNPFSSILT